MDNDKSKRREKYHLVTIIINTMLAIFKVIAGILGKSSAMMADGVHTFSDIATQ